jgi:hypothetical protein
MVKFEVIPGRLPDGSISPIANEVCGHLLAYFELDYKSIKRVFGVPTSPSIIDDYKCQCDWIIKFGKKIVYIYDWKSGSQYQGRGKGTPKSKVNFWSIGGCDRKLAAKIAGLLGLVETKDKYDTITYKKFPDFSL